MRTNKISIILVRMNTDQCVENIIFIMATEMIIAISGIKSWSLE